MKKKSLKTTFTTNDFSRALSFFNVSEKRKLKRFYFAQTSLGLLDIIGVSLIGAVTALIVNSLNGTATGDRLSFVISALGLQNVSARNQIIIMSIIAILFLSGKTIISAYLTRKTIFYLSVKSAEISKLILEKVLTQPLQKIQSFQLSKVLYSLNDGADKISIGLIGSTFNLLSESTVLILLVSSLFILSPINGIIVVSFFGSIGFALFLKFRLKSGDIGTKFSVTRIANNQKISDTLSTYRELSTRNAITGAEEAIFRQRLNLAKLAAELNFMPNISKYVFEVAIFLGIALTVLTQFALNDNARAISEISIFMIASFRIAPMIARIQSNLIVVKGSFGAARPTLDLWESLEVYPKLRKSSRSADFDYEGFTGSISISNVKFNYLGDENWALSTPQILIKEGEFYAVAGPSGSGKSTLMDLLLGLNSPNEGSIEISGVTPRECFERWPGAISYVPQEIFIVSGTVMENVALGFTDSDVSTDRVWECLKIAELEEMFLSLPGGLLTHIGDRGHNLSGGEKQRLGIARALYSNPRVLFIDEGTSSLDGTLEFRITKNLLKERKNTTLIVIAHRLSTIQDADKIIYIENGEILATDNFNILRTKVPNFNKQAEILGL